MYSKVRYHRLLHLILPLFAIFIGACGVAELSPQFSHQGRLLDSEGNPVPDGEYDVQYRLYQVQNGGDAVYTDTQTITVSGGLFTASIGATEEITPSIFASPTWMEITIDGETLSPRQRLQGAPYAFSLVPEAVIQGSVPITRTYLGQENTGAAMTILNTDSSPYGGNGLVVANFASPQHNTNPNPSIDIRQNVAALQAIATGGIEYAGGYGAIIRSQQYRGMYASGAEDFYAGVFDSDIGILLTGGGNCSGCALAYMAQNSGDSEIEKGDLVAVSGVVVDEDFDMPVMQVYKATSADDPIIGVATHAVERNQPVEVEGKMMGGYEGIDGPAKPGTYLSVAVEGLVQVKADAGSGLSSGDYLTLQEGTVTAAEGNAQPVARALGEVENGLVWVMFSGQ
jgi:hypothetical protein